MYKRVSTKISLPEFLHNFSDPEREIEGGEEDGKWVEINGRQIRNMAGR